MSKQLASRRLIFEIDTLKLKKDKWNVILDIEEARKNGQLIAIFDSDVLRMIRALRKKDYSTEDIKKVKDEIKKIKRLNNCADNKKQIKQLNDKLNKMMFMPEYVSIVMKSNKDYDKASKGFFINGEKFVELLGSPNGVKKNKVIYIQEKIYKIIYKQLNNDRNEDIPCVPAKLQAYLSLACSNSTPVSEPRGILVVPDSVTKFKSNVTLIDDTNSDTPIIKQNYEFDKVFESSDGNGLISPRLMRVWQEDLQLNYMPSGVCIRNAFTKGMLFPFDFHKFATEIAKNNIVKDVWGHEYDINDIDIILTTSMLKLWKCYDNIEQYIEATKRNGFGFSVTKTSPETLENERRLNYQFIQALDLNKEDIDNLVKPTVSELKEVLGLDCEKTMLFMGGETLGKYFYPSIEDKIIASLMLNQDCINDTYIRNSIHKTIKKKIDETKYGKIKVRGNFQIIADDPYILCETVFGFEPKGLLSSGKFYSHYWNKLNVKEVAAFRAPMSCQSNARYLHLDNTEEMRKWYKYMKNVFILNSWDMTCDAINGADKDGDMIMTTDNPIILKGVIPLNAILCVQKNAEKKKVTLKDMRESNKKAFGNEVGSVTNRVTSMYEVMAGYDKNSEEYKALEYRIQCGQNYQQNSIDKCKGIVCKDMPKEWYDYKSLKIKEDDTDEIKAQKEFDKKIVANKKPYFMCYIYPKLMKDYKNFINNTNKNCLMRFGIDVDNLINKVNKTEEEIIYLEYYKNKMPVGINPCIMNQIAWKVEDEFKDIKNSIKKTKFDKTIYMTDISISKTNKKKMLNLYDKYKKTVTQFMKNANREKTDKETKKEKFNEFINVFLNEALKICSNEEEMCNTLIDSCYEDINARGFIWNIAGKQILRNLAKNNNNTIKYPIRKENGNVTFNGESFTFLSREMKEEEINAINS